MSLPTPTTPAYTTKRLVVFRQDLVISETLCADRILLTAFLREEDTPRVICTMLVTKPCPAFNCSYLDWIATDEDFRRKGYAEEMWRGYEATFGKIVADGASEAGEALCTKMEVKP